MKDYELKNQISAELSQCNPESTPYICKLIQVANTRANIEADILNTVNKTDSTITQAIITLERELDPNIEAD